MQIPDKLQQVGLLLHHDGLVPVLEEVAHALVAAIKDARIRCLNLTGLDA
jgi:hypothetical protein